MRNLTSYLRKSQIVITALSCIFLSNIADAENHEGEKVKAPYTEKLNYKDLGEVKKIVKKNNSNSTKDKIIALSHHFSGRPYDYDKGEKLITWDRRKDKKKLIELSKFDCLSYVETLLALSTMPNIPDNNKDFLREFKENLSSIMFAVNDVSFTGRNHFIDTEWLKNNNRLITANLIENLPYAKEKTAKIDKAAFLENQLKDYAEKYVKEENRKKFINKFKNNLSKFIPLESKIKYISFEDYISHEEELNKAIDDKIYLFVMIMDNPKLLEETKSEHNVGHVGFVYKKDGKVVLDHATSSNNKTTVIVDFAEYAKNKIDNDTLIGFSLYELK